MKRLMYSQHRAFDTDIHVLEFKASDFVVEAVQPITYQPVTSIKSGWWEGKGYKKIAAMNCSFFPIKGLNYLYGGQLYSDGSVGDKYFNLVYDDDGLHVDDLDYKTMLRKYTGVQWAIPAGHMLVYDGKKNHTKADMYTHSYQRHPRSIIAKLLNNNLAFIVIEGRNSDDAGGESNEISEFLISLGCIWAVNCDGGGSTTLELDGKTVNYLSDGRQRAVANALTLYTNDKVVVEREYLDPSYESDILKPVKSLLTVIDKVEVAPDFTLAELACRHCGKVKFEDYNLLTVAQAVRDRFGATRLVGYRCPEHNAAIGGDPNSAHMQGRALDISAWNGQYSPEQAYSFIKAKFDTEYVQGFGIYDGHVHIDTYHNGTRVYWDKRT